MYCIIKEWKELNLNLNLVHAWMQTNAAPSYCGNVARQYLELWFTEEPSEEVKNSISEYWDSLTEESEEAKSYTSSNDLQSMISAAKEDAVTKTWDELSTAQKKLIMGLVPTKEELEA